MDETTEGAGVRVGGPINPCAIFGVSIEIGTTLMAAISFLRKFVEAALLFMFLMMLNYALDPPATEDEYVTALFTGGSEDERMETLMMETALSAMVAGVLLLAIYYESRDLVSIWLIVHIVECIQVYQLWVVWAFKKHVTLIQTKRQVGQVLNASDNDHDRNNNNNDHEESEVVDTVAAIGNNGLVVPVPVPNWLNVLCCMIALFKIYNLFRPQAPILYRYYNGIR